MKPFHLVPVMARATADRGGLAGSIKGRPQSADLPLLISGLNPRWVAGVWRSEAPTDFTDQFGFAWFTDEQVAENLKLFDLLGIEGADERLWDRSILDEVYQNGPTA